MNAAYLNLIDTRAGAKRVVSIDEVLPNLSEGAGSRPGHRRSQRGAEDKEYENSRNQIGEHGRPRDLRTLPSEPKVHIDINIHIDQSATSEQIDQIFASMARHLYRTES